LPEENRTKDFRAFGCIGRESRTVVSGVFMDQAEEKTLVRGLVKMDEGAWEVFCSEYSLPLLTYVRVHFACSRELAEEVVQMSFVRCVKSIKSFNPSQGHLFAWLKAVARNEARTLLSTCRPRAEAAFGIACDAIEALDDAVLPDEVLARKEAQLLVHEALMELPSRSRRVLTLKYLENCRVAEIARLLGQSEKAIESLLSRSRDAFRAMFLKKANGGTVSESGRIDGI
jgi:RNA polymerase sigma-70 factor (ECF subfamily)